MVNYGIIYKATNKMTGKVYVGQTIKELSTRISGHFKAAINAKNKRGYSSKFYRAIRKYGECVWKWNIVCCAPVEDLNMQEVITIEVLNSFYAGYNSTKGGEDNPMNYKSNRDKISRALTGKKRNDLSNRNKKFPLLGEHNPSAILNKIAVDNIRDKYLSGGYTTKELAREFDVSSQLIKNIINNKIWKDERLDKTAISRAKYINRSRKCRGSKNPGVKLNAEVIEEIRKRYGETKISHKLLSLHYGVSESTIEKIVNNKIWAK